MKTDKHFSFIRICPKTRTQVSEDAYAYSKGVCHVCGHIDNGTFTHAVRATGHWVRPTLWEWIRGSRAFFQTVAVEKTA